MSIVLNEYEWAEGAIESKDIGSKPVKTLDRVAKYYLARGYSKKDTRVLLESFFLQSTGGPVTSSWSDLLDKIVKNAGKYPLIQVDGVSISKKEMEIIETLDGSQLRRLAFTLLCIAKFKDIVSPLSNHWVKEPDREVMCMANINTSVKRQCLLFSQLRDAGLIKFAKRVDNLSVQVLFESPGDEAMFVSDFRNLGYQYMKYYGGQYMECENCGITDKIRNPGKGRRQKYCPSCAAEIHTRQKVNSVMRKRDTLQENAC